MTGVLLVILARVYREPAKLLGFVVAMLALLTFLGLLDEKASGLVLAAVAAAIGLLSYVVSPAWEVEVQRRPGLPPVAGAASDLKTGTPVEVDVVPAGAPPAVQAEVRRIRAERQATGAVQAEEPGPGYDPPPMALDQQPDARPGDAAESLQEHETD